MGIGCSLRFLLALLPALVANGTPVAAKRFLSKKNLHPIDRGYVMPDGRRLLGDGKTVEGFLLAVAVGSVLALILYVLTLDITVLKAGIAASLGAMIGDITGSFIKRRLGIKRGDPAPLLDQLDFYLGAASFIWISGIHFGAIEFILCAIVVVFLHVSTNYMAYRAGLKEVPW